MSVYLHVLPLLAAIALQSCASDRHSDTSTNGYSGARLYQVYCSSCHGADARGNGPVSPYINVAVPDLTHMALANGGDFPAEKIYRVVDGQSDSPAHGERHMPVWGYEFFGDEGDDRSAHQQATDKVDSLVTYLRSVQQSK